MDHRFACVYCGKELIIRNEIFQKTKPENEEIVAAHFSCHGKQLKKNNEIAVRNILAAAISTENCLAVFDKNDTVINKRLKGFIT